MLRGGTLSVGVFEADVLCTHGVSGLLLRIFFFNDPATTEIYTE